MNRLKDQWKGSRHLEFLWKTSNTTSLFTHILDSHYSAPSGFDWEYAFNGGLGGFSPAAPHNPVIITSSTSPFLISNVKERADAFVKEMKIRAAWFRTNNLLVPHGDDFHYQVLKIEIPFPSNTFINTSLNLATIVYKHIHAHIYTHIYIYIYIYIHFIFIRSQRPLLGDKFLCR